MVDASLNGITEPEGSFSEEIYHAGAREGEKSRLDYWRGMD